MELTTLFGQIDDFWADFEAEYYQHLMADGRIKRVRQSRLGLSKGICCTNATYDPICYIRNQVYCGLNLAD